MRHNIRGTFLQVLEQTRLNNVNAGTSVLCMHHCVEGATLIMGTRLHTFRNNHDVISLRDIPTGIAAVLSGHIHRFQVLTRDLHGNPLPVPVFYPGSIERTSFTEKDEPKGYLTLEINPGTNTVSDWRFHELPARPMTALELRADGITPDALNAWIKNSLFPLPQDSVVRLRIHGRLPAPSLEILSAQSLRSLAPSTMNLTVTLPDYRKGLRQIG